MPLPSAPPISLSEILAEFRVPATTPFASMIRGGTFVPITASSNIPTALPIDFLDFLGVSLPASAVISDINVINATEAGATTIDGLTAIVSADHPTITGYVTAESFPQVDVTFRIDRATTPKLRLSVRAANPTSGIYRLPHTDFDLPQQLFDSGVELNSGAGPLYEGTVEPRRGLISCRCPAANIETLESNRIAQAAVLSNACADGQSFTVSFGATHRIQHSFGPGVPYGSTYAHNCIGTSVTYELALLFLDGAGTAIVQELPVSITISYSGLLQAYAV